MNGIVILNKPSGISSNYACKKVGKILKEKKVGHLGTLDPMAEGVLPVTLGKCTKLFDYYLNKNKTYLANFTFGRETDTLDLEGNIIVENGRVPSLEELQEVVKEFEGEQYQVPPKFSAKKINGKRAYDLARDKKDFELKPKLINIYSIECLKQINNDTFQFKIDCSSGTYIRSIARDLAYKLKTYAFMSKLVRTKCGEFCLEKSIDFDNVNYDNIVTVDEIFRNIKKIYINEKQYFEFINSGRVYLNQNNDNLNTEFLLVYNNEIISKGTLNDGCFINQIRFI